MKFHHDEQNEREQILSDSLDELKCAHEQHTHNARKHENAKHSEI